MHGDFREQVTALAAERCAETVRVARLMLQHGAGSGGAGASPRDRGGGGAADDGKASGTDATDASDKTFLGGRTAVSRTASGRRLSRSSGAVQVPPTYQPTNQLVLQQ